MKHTLSNLFIFAAGAAIGSVVTWKLINDKCDKRVQDEIESMDEYYRAKYGVEDIEEDSDELEGSTDQIDIREYAAELARQKYVNYSDKNRDDKEVDNVDRPYVISPEEFDELDGYETTTLYYHADGVLTDDQGEPVEDVDDAVGIDSLNHFGEYEDDSVFVRNDARRVDYEILYDYKPYSSGINTFPHLAED